MDQDEEFDERPEEDEDEYRLFSHNPFSLDSESDQGDDPDEVADADDNVELRFLRFVHKSYKRPDKTAIATPRQQFDHTRAYRVLTPMSDESEVLSDVSVPANIGDKNHLKVFNLIRLFYIGAEADLDRYLRWLNNVALVNAYGLPKELIVVEQLTSDLQSANFESLQQNNKIVILFPGELDTYGLLIGGKTRPGVRHRWHIY